MSGAAASADPRWRIERRLDDLEATEHFAQALAAVLRPGDVLILTGGLGAGKTTFTQSLAAALGVSGRVSSPTFVLSRIHRAEHDGPDLVHVDAYRTDAAGVEGLDLVSTRERSVTVVEWGRGVAEEALVGVDGSWLDLELVDPAVPQAPAAPVRGAAPSDGPGAPEIITDFSESEEDLLGSARRAVLRGFGPRWAEGPQLP
ncbi:tRNA (adenosine(37)-N6)-threonylcarbamoyltransferase complex ATPase subunit type 1 TsaE [Nesterenkonia sp. F]|uniref:tRNA (adenosine(37)-N6)-threonylcarbamoyltransferase complex ATPase subunit type 1 TsaE n=1 Tax=Nesterenkonia sp. F TaxID=795955 RepID=UPI000255D08B|nr:tRNA (adenosine(37)-N6)-threonylcarbamoyltransferase complex ATPase subunit type 1 TsaE [Nesterenkonia sp. F]